MSLRAWSPARTTMAFGSSPPGRSSMDASARPGARCCPAASVRDRRADGSTRGAASVSVAASRSRSCSSSPPSRRCTCRTMPVVPTTTRNSAATTLIHLWYFRIWFSKPFSGVNIFSKGLLGRTTKAQLVPCRLPFHVGKEVPRLDLGQPSGEFLQIGFDLFQFGERELFPASLLGDLRQQSVAAFGE